MNMLSIVVPIFGLFAGSFLNQCIDRLPDSKSKNPFKPLCPSCEEPVSLYQKIPLFGYILSGGKCAQCDAPTSLRYPIMEFATGLVVFFLLKKYGFSLEFLAKTFFILLLVLISWIDLKTGAIPNILGITGLCIGFVLAFFRKPFFFYQDALYGILACGGLLLVIAFFCEKLLEKEIVGFGDTMLLCIIGAFCGLKGAVFSLVTGSLLGTLIGIPMMLMQGKGAKFSIPFGPLLSLGALLFMFFGDRLVYTFVRFVSGG